MKKVFFSVMNGLFLCFLVGCNEAPMAVAKIVNSNGEQIGTATLKQMDQGVEITVEAHGLPSGIHGFHIHEVGKCQEPDFQSAGGHFNPHGKKHGRNHPEGEHAGDLQNIVVDSSGEVKNTQVIKQVTLEKDEVHSLLKETGTALVIHESADDYRTDPAGNSGKRIACGVIEEK